MKTPASQIPGKRRKASSKPVPYEHWKKTLKKELYQDGVQRTYTRVVNVKKDGKVDSDTRRAYGRDAKGVRFYIEMRRTQEPEFRRTYARWLAKQHVGKHLFLSDPGGQPPPNCGSANSPPC